MIGTFINVAMIIIGGLAGLLLGGKLPEKLKQTVVAGLGIFTIALGLQMFLKTNNSLVVLGSLLVGAILGEWWRIEDGLESLGGWLQDHLVRSDHEGDRQRFIQGFLVSSLLFCIGPVAVLGSIQDGLTGDYNLLAVKSVMDGFAAMAFASSLGVGVLFSSLPILFYQGGITLMANRAESLITAPMISEMSAVGGVLLVAIAISSLLEIRKIRTGNLLPAIFIAPIIVAIIAALGLL